MLRDRIHDRWHFTRGKEKLTVQVKGRVQCDVHLLPVHLGKPVRQLQTKLDFRVAAAKFMQPFQHHISPQVRRQ